MATDFHPLVRDQAETVALQALAFIASDATRLTAFLADTGIGLDQLHAEAGSDRVMQAVLEALLRNESDLLVFTANAGLSPDSVLRAHAAFDGRPPAN